VRRGSANELVDAFFTTEGTESTEKSEFVTLQLLQSRGPAVLDPYEERPC
jgi:hypothetical protein